MGELEIRSLKRISRSIRFGERGPRKQSEKLLWKDAE